MRALEKLFRVVPRVEAVGALILILAAAMMLIEGGRFPNLQWRFGGSPGFLPRILALVLILLAVLMVWEAWRKPTRAALPPRGKRLLMVFALLCLFAMPTLLLPYLGFPLSALLFMAAIMFALLRWRVDGRQAAQIAVAAVLVTAIVYVSFSYLARVNLPKGVLIGWP